MTADCEEVGGVIMPAMRDCGDNKTSSFEAVIGRRRSTAAVAAVQVFWEDSGNSVLSMATEIRNSDLKKFQCCTIIFL